MKTIRLDTLRALGVAALAAALLFGCGGVGTGGTGAFVSSTVEGYGSVIVGGVEFDDRASNVLDDDGAMVNRNGNEVRLGMTVDVDGSAITDTATGRSATAGTIHIVTAVLGPVDAIDTGARTLTVLGQQLQVTGATVFGPSLRGGLSALRTGDVVAAFALPSAVGGSYVATRIEMAPAAKAYRLRGVVSALDGTAKTFSVGGAALSYANASNVPADLANGRLVRVRITPSRSAAVWSIETFGTAVERPPEGDTVIAEGLVTSFASSTSFAVNGFAVDATQAQFDPNAGAVAAGVYAIVEGRIANGTLAASRVKVLSTSAVGARSYRITGSISNLDTGAKTFVVRNVDVDYSAAQFVGGTAANLANSVTVRVEGPLSADGTQVKATQVRFQ
jgi:hypothetical protein